MMDMKSLLASGNLNCGFAGGSYVDKLPHLTLTEATGQLPTIIIESQIQFNEYRSSSRKRLLTEGASELLLESTFSDLRDKVEAFFERILKWIRSIIAKIKIQIDKITMSSKDFYEKYYYKLGRDADYKGLTFEGYRFAEGLKVIESLRDSYYVDVESLIKHSLEKAGVNNVQLPSDFGRRMHAIAQRTPEGETVRQDIADQLANEINEITDISKPERVQAIASVLVGRQMPENWEEDLRKKAWGEKCEINYGTDMFYPLSIGDALKDNSLAKCLEGYKHLEKNVATYRTKLKTELSDLYGEFLNNTNTLNFPGNMNAQLIIHRYYNAYISVVSDALSTVAQLKNLKITFYTDMRRQAVAMLIRMVNSQYDPSPKSNGNESQAKSGAKED